MLQYEFVAFQEARFSYASTGLARRRGFIEVRKLALKTRQLEDLRVYVLILSVTKEAVFALAFTSQENTYVFETCVTRGGSLGSPNF